MSCKRRDGKGETNLFHTIQCHPRDNVAQSRKTNKQKKAFQSLADRSKQTDKTERTDNIIFRHSIAGIKNYYAWVQPLLPVDCCKRCRTQVFPDPGKLAKAVMGSFTFEYPCGLQSPVGPATFLLPLLSLSPIGFKTSSFMFIHFLQAWPTSKTCFVMHGFVRYEIFKLLRHRNTLINLILKY